MSRNIRILGSEINWYWMDLSLTMSHPNYLIFLCAKVLRNHDVRAWCNWTKSLLFSPPDRKNRESLYHFGTIVYQPTWMVKLYGKCTYSKYTSPMDAVLFLKVFNYPAHKRSHMKENFLTPKQTNLTETFHHCWMSPSTFKVFFPSSWCQAVPKQNEAPNLETKFGDASFIASTNPKTSEKQMFGDPVRIPGSSTKGFYCSANTHHTSDTQLFQSHGYVVFVTCFRECHIKNPIPVHGVAAQHLWQHLCFVPSNSPLAWKVTWMSPPAICFSWCSLPQSGHKPKRPTHMDSQKCTKWIKMIQRSETGAGEV